MKYTLLISFLTVSLLASSQNGNQSSLSLYDIMQGEEFVGYLPERVRWSENSQEIYFSWNLDKDTVRSTYSVSPVSKTIKKLSFDELNQMSGRGRYNADFSQKVYEKNGDLFLLSTSDYKVIQISNTLVRESGPSFSADGKFVIYRQG